MDVLEEALRHIIANNGAPGVDGISVSALKESAELREKFLRDLQSELQAKCYQPSPVRRVLIPKPNGKKRPLGIPTVKDRVVQTAAVILLLPICEADMHEHSYAYRPRRNARQAMDQIKSAILRGHTEILDADLSAYFAPPWEVDKTGGPSRERRHHAPARESAAAQSDSGTR